LVVKERKELQCLKAQQERKVRLVAKVRQVAKERRELQAHRVQ